MRNILLMFTGLALASCGTGNGLLLSQQDLATVSGPASYQQTASCLFEYFQASSALADIRKTDLVSPTRSVISREQGGITLWTIVITPDGTGSKSTLTEAKSVFGHGAGLSDRRGAAIRCSGAHG